MADLSRGDEKLVYLEMGRALAAMVVVLHHADQATAHFSDTLQTRHVLWGQYGVDFFFVLSGFIIYHAHRQDSGGLTSARLYMFKRITRIYLPYLPIALIYMGLLLLFQSGPLADRPWGIWATLTLLPMDKASTLTVAWTLTYELIFYTYFLIAFWSRKALLVTSVLWGAALLGGLAGLVTFPQTAVIAALSNPIILEFFCGMLAAWGLSRVPVQLRWAILGMGLASLAVAILTWDGQRVVLGPPLALIVLGAAMFRYPVPDRATRFLIFLGAASYAIYLVHSPIVSIIAEVLEPQGLRFVTFVACVVLGTLGGIIYHLSFERPALRWVRRFRPIGGPPQHRFPTGPERSA